MRNSFFFHTKNISDDGNARFRRNKMIFFLGHWTVSIYCGHGSCEIIVSPWKCPRNKHRKQIGFGRWELLFLLLLCRLRLRRRWRVLRNRNKQHIEPRAPFVRVYTWSGVRWSDHVIRRGKIYYTYVFTKRRDLNGCY